MRPLIVLGSCLAATSIVTAAQVRIECKPTDKNSEADLWPEIYLSDSEQLCFDVAGMSGYRGNNCVRNGKSTQWHGIAIVSVNGESQGRDDTDFRVRSAVVTKEQLKYKIEWRRAGLKWQPMQIVEINRLTGQGVSWFLGMHGGESLLCRKLQKAI